MTGRLDGKLRCPQPDSLPATQVLIEDPEPDCE